MRIIDWSSDVCSSDLTFDAEAAAYSIDRVLDPANESSVKAFVPTIESVEATGTMTLEVTTVGPDPQAPGGLIYVRSAERRAGTACVSTSKSRRSRQHYTRNASY